MPAGWPTQAISKPRAFTADDRDAERRLSGQCERQAALDGATDMEGYLKNLSMTLSRFEDRKIDLPRAAQLINKSNQYNLTTRRYTEAELARLVDDTSCWPCVSGCGTGSETTG